MKEESKGKGWYGDSKGHSEAGRLGGEAVKKSRGKEHFSEMGKVGGKKGSCWRDMKGVIIGRGMRRNLSPK